MASSVSSPLHPLSGSPALLPPPSSPQPPPSARLLLPRHPSPPSISAPGNTARHGGLTPVVRAGWRDPSALSYSLLSEFLEDNGADGGEGSSPLPPSAAESVAAAYPALANAHVLWFKSGFYNFQVTVREDEPEEELFRRLRKEVIKSGVIRECRRRRFFEDKQAKKKRKAREAARKNRRMAFAAAGSSPPPYVLPRQGGRSQGGGAKKSGKRSKSKRRRPARTPGLDLREAPKKDEDEEEDNWELPEVEVPY